MKLFQYGCSVSLGEEATICYGELIAEQLNAKFVQLSESSASNPHIALKFCETYQDITAEDLVIFGWSHPNRQSWYNTRTECWEHMNYVQNKKSGSRNYLQVKQLALYACGLCSWYGQHTRC